MKRLLAFDLETAMVLPEPVSDLLAFRPLGITCAVAISSTEPEPLVWHAGRGSGSHSKQMSTAEATEVVAALESFVADGWQVVTWNGLGFDFPVLADESGLKQRCIALALQHVDMFFHVLCSQGHYISLQKASEGMGLSGKAGGLSGAAAPSLWAAGRCTEVLDYCTQDVRLALALAERGEARKALSWVTRRGSRRYMPLTGGWLSVSEARRLPLPDTSWMTAPPSREQLYGWMT